MLWFALICVGDDHKDDDDNGAILVMATAVVVLFQNARYVRMITEPSNSWQLPLSTFSKQSQKALLSRPLGLQHAKDAGSCLNHFRHVV